MCDEAHPESGQRCINRSPNHADHQALGVGFGAEAIVWPNRAYVPPAPTTRKGRRQTHSALAGVRDAVERANGSVSTPEPPSIDRAPSSAIARGTDPATSHDAAATVGPLRPLQQAVLDVLRAADQPLTDEEIYERLGEIMSVSGARTRRDELVKVGLVEDSGQRGLTEANRQTIKWRAASGA